jgi:hypothetical protein
MKIINRTVWRTDHLKAILQAAAERELEPSKRKVLIVTVSYTRGGHSSGCAWIKGRNATVRVRHPESRAQYAAPMVKSELVLHFASVASHEFAHIRGMRHSNMPLNYTWRGRWREYVAWAADMPLEVKPVTAKAAPTPDVKLAHVQAMLKTAETRMKRAATIVRKWKARERYYLRAMAARASQ